MMNLKLSPYKCITCNAYVVPIDPSYPIYGCRKCGWTGWVTPRHVTFELRSAPGQGVEAGSDHVLPELQPTEGVARTEVLLNAGSAPARGQDSLTWPEAVMVFVSIVLYIAFVVGALMGGV